MVRVTLLHASDCPNWREVESLLTRLPDELSIQIELELREVVGIDEARRMGFPGSPTVLIDGHDPFPSSGEASLSCRLYATEEGLRGVPATEDLRRALQQAADRG